jgi:hypothetical protein
MKHRFAWASTLALAVAVGSPVRTTAATNNGVILISTRAPQDTAAGTEYTNDEKGPGMATPGDVAMASLLSDYGYSCRLVLDKILGDTAGGWLTAPPPRDSFLNPVDPNFTPILAIMSGSGGSTDTPPPTQTNGIPEMMGEHVCLGANGARPGSLYMYTGTASNDPNQGNTTNLYMKVVNPTHPIMQGIPLDAQGRVKIFRDPYPQENAHIPTNSSGAVVGKLNYEFRWCTQDAAAAAPGTVILGVMAGETSVDGTNRACFAVCDVGGLLAVNPNLGYAETNQVRLVQLFWNEQGSGGPRRVFNALTDLGKVLFVRAAKWAMGETLEPYQGLGLIDVSLVGPQQIQLSWQGHASQSYKIIGIADLQKANDITQWQTVAQDIPGINGIVSRRLDISQGAQYAFLRVAPMQ